MSQDCLFCKIVAGEIPANLVHEDTLCVAFADINPQAPTHLLIVPREHVESMAARSADKALMGHLMTVASDMANVVLRLGKGYRVVVNTGDDGGQTVPHLHLHLLGGRPMHWPPG